MASCTTTKYVEVPKEVIKKEYINTIKYDSVYIHDSIDRYLSNDTLYIYKQNTVIKYKMLSDTILKVDTITITQIKEVTKEVPVHELYWHQRALMILGIILLLYIGIKIGLKYFKG